MPDSFEDSNFDLIIIGGGLAGASLACALRDVTVSPPLKIAVVEAHELNTGAQPSYDDRTVALSWGSRCIFDSMGLWSLLEAGAEAINTIHISDRGHFGVTKLTSEQEGVEALGYVLENRVIGQQLYTAIKQSQDKPGSEIRMFCPASLLSLQQDESRVTVEIRVNDKLQRLSAQLLVAADGNNSTVMQLQAIGNNRQGYGQVALVTNVSPDRKHNNVAYERFTDSGPLAFLPMPGDRYSVVWTLRPEQADYLYALDDDEFLAQLQQRFGYRAGRLTKAGSRHIYPLFLQSASRMVQGRIALIGNAAHSVHPVAGQGFNLGLRDIALLAELIVNTRQGSDDIGKPEVLDEYVRLRERDIQRVYQFTDTLVKIFSNAITPLAHLRSCGLLMVDLIPDIKHRLARQSMGLNGRLTRLNRGLHL